MIRKLLILGAIAALFTVVSVVPASAIAVNTGNGALTALDPDTADGANDAHGPACFSIETCVHNGSSAAAAENTVDVPGLTAKKTPLNPEEELGTNLGAWNAFFESDENSAICGITTTFPPTNTCDVLP
jgi:hypothetical protein